MALRPRHSRRRYPDSGDGRFSLCFTRVARVDVHARRRPTPRYRAILTGASVIATILVALAVWPRDSVTFPGMYVAGASPQGQLVARYTIDDFVSRMH